MRKIIDEYTELPISTKLKWYKRHLSLKARGGIDMRGKTPRLKTGESRKCLNCSKEIYVMPSVIKIGKGKYCSMKCYGKGAFGKKHRENMRKARLGKHVSEESKLKNRMWHLGRKFSNETRLKMREAHLGEKSTFWKGGIWNAERMKYHKIKRRKCLANAEGLYTEGEWYELKRKFENRCLSCFQSEPIIKLTADHVVPLSLGGKNSIENIQPLCASCNSRKYTKSTDFRTSYV